MIGQSISHLPNFIYININNIKVTWDPTENRGGGGEVRLNKRRGSEPKSGRGGRGREEGALGPSLISSPKINDN